MQEGILETAFPEPASPAPASPTKAAASRSLHASTTTLVTFTASGLIAVYSHAGSITVLALGLSYAVLVVLAFTFIERSQRASWTNGQHGDTVIYSASGILTHPTATPLSDEEKWMATLRDASAAAFVTTGIAALGLENLRFGGLAYYGLLGQALGTHWVFGQGVVSFLFAVATILMHIVMSGALILMVSYPSLRKSLPNIPQWARKAWPRGTDCQFHAI